MKVVLSLGRLHPLKGLDLLVEAWAMVRRSSKVLKCESAKVQLETGGEGESSKVLKCESAKVQLETGGEGESSKVLKCESAKVAEDSTDTEMNADNFRTLELPNFRTSSWQLVIAGPDEQGTLEKLKALSEKLKLKTAETSDLASAADADIVFTGPVHGDEKWALMQRAEIFVLPSRSENFGMVAGEALSCGVPVVTTAVGPWGGGECANAGMRECANGIPRQGEAAPGLIVVETSVEGIAEGVRRMMALSDAERKEMGRQGCEWVRREFSWESVAKQMVAAYEEVLKF